MTVLGDLLQPKSPDVPLSEVRGKSRTSMAFAERQIQDRLASEGYSDRGIALVMEQIEARALRLETLSESPIERAMIGPLLTTQYTGFDSTFPEVHLPKEDWRLPRADLFIVPQFAILKYRLDFAVIGRHGDQSKIVALECDGAEYHKDTGKDARKTMYLESAGISVVRATGSEIIADPVLIARAVARHLIEWKMLR